MGEKIKVYTSECFYDRWRVAHGVYWARAGGSSTSAKIVMSYKGGSCPSSGETHRILGGKTATFGNGSYKVQLLDSGSNYSLIEIWKIAETDPDNGVGFGKAEITQTNIGPGLVFNVGSNIEYSLRVMNTGNTGKVYGAIGLGYHDKTGNVYFTGRYAKEEIELSSGLMVTWNGNIEVLHKDYAAREMTSRGPGVYFMSGHDEQGKVIWDRSEYIPVELILESGYVDPLDPDGVPDDWPEPVYDDSRPWDFVGDIIPTVSKFVEDLIPKKEEEPEEEPIDMMPFIYMGFIGLIGYLLIRGR